MVEQKKKKKDGSNTNTDKNKNNSKSGSNNTSNNHTNNMNGKPRESSETEPTRQEPSVSMARSSASGGGGGSALWGFLAVMGFGLGVVIPALFPEEADQVMQLTKPLQKKLHSSLSSRLLNSNHVVKPSPPWGCTEDNLAQYLHDAPVKGMHILCIKTLTTSQTKNQDKTPTVSMEIYPNASGNSTTLDDIPASWKHFRQSLVESLGLDTSLSTEHQQHLEESYKLLSPHDKLIRWSLYDFYGRRLASNTPIRDLTSKQQTQHMEHVQAAELVILMEGGTWQWPGVRLGFERKVNLNPPSILSSSSAANSVAEEDGHTVTLKTLSLIPLVLSVDRFLSQSECQHVKDRALPIMKYSGVSLMDKDKGKEAKNWRTSSTAFVESSRYNRETEEWEVDEVLKGLEDKVALLTRIERRNQEDIQVLRYESQQRYAGHHDYFGEAFYTDNDSIRKMTRNFERNRFVTVFWYLSDVEEGGETIFPRTGGVMNNDLDGCETGLKVKPQQGKVIIFYSQTADGVNDEYSLHGACPVIKGIKWAANKWIWNEQMHYVR